MSEIQGLIDEGILESTSGKIACPNCEEQAVIYVHKYDPDISAASCPNCKNCEWLNDIGAKDNPRRCPYCNEYVTDEDINEGRSVQCNEYDAREDRCEQLTHKDCVEFCEKCGWFCEEHQSNCFECDHCGLYHENDHIVSTSTEAQKLWGFICEDCFYGDDQEDVEAQEQSLDEIVDSKRIDCSKYLHHFVGKDSELEITNLEKLISILKSHTIEARDTGYFSVYSPQGKRI